MTLFNIILRSLIVLSAVAIIFISVSYEKYNAETLVISVENPVERLFGVTEAKEAAGETNAEIFKRSTLAYLATDEQKTPGKVVLRPLNDTANRLIVAKHLSKQGKHDKALRILENAYPSDLSSFDVRFLQAQIYSKAKDFKTAEDIFRQLRAEFPHDPDLMVARAHLYLDQGQLSKAESLFSKTLVGYPGYEDAKAGLTLVRQARRQ